jgi:AraC-like DNA-binding protein
MSEVGHGRRVARAHDGDSYLFAIPGVSGTLVRCGEGTRPTVVTTARVGAVDTATLDVGFPIVGEALADDDSLVLAAVVHAPAGGTWDGVELLAGQTFIYPPGANQHARDPVGLQVALVAAPWLAVESAADTLGLCLESARRRRVTTSGRGSRLAALVADRMRDTSGSTPSPAATDVTADQLLDAVVHVACDPLDGDDAVDARRARGWSSSEIVRDAIAAMDSTDGWMAPVLTLCRRVGVSERRLQTAFRQQFAMGPNEFMRLRALQRVRTALLRADPTTALVSSIATAHGFTHAGRFAAYYRTTFGERPLDTLQRRPA